MVTREQAEEAVNKVMHSLQNLTFMELKELSDEIETNPEKALLRVPVHGGDVELGLMVSEMKALRKRICVEVNALDFVNKHSFRVPGFYFERFKSGKLFVANRLALLRLLFVAIGIICAISLVLIGVIYYTGK